MPKSQGFCIFCDGPGLTKEHVIANWTSAYITKNVADHGKMSIQIDNPGSREIVRPPVLKKVSGDPRSRQVRQVCGECNGGRSGGWMGKQQQLAKPIALPLILGKRTTLSYADQKTLAIWIMMTVMVSEFSDPDLGGIPKQDRHLLRIFQHPVPNWKIFIGRYPEGMTKPYLHHESASFALEDGSREDALNTQCTTYSVGHLYVHAISSKNAGWINRTRTGLGSTSWLRQLWPVIDAPLIWPPPLSLTEADAESIPGALYRAGAAINRRIEEATKGRKS